MYVSFCSFKLFIVYLAAFKQFCTALYRRKFVLDMLLLVKTKSKLQADQLEAIWNLINESVNKGDMDAELCQATEKTFTVCDCVVIAIEKLETGIVILLNFYLFVSLGSSATLKKKEKAERRAEQLKDKSLTRKEEEAEQLKLALQKTDQEKAQALQAEQLAAVQVAFLLNQVEPFFVTSDDIKRFPKPSMILILNSSDVVNNEDWGHYANLLQPNGIICDFLFIDNFLGFIFTTVSDFVKANILRTIFEGYKLVIAETLYLHNSKYWDAPTSLENPAMNNSILIGMIVVHKNRTNKQIEFRTGEKQSTGNLFTVKLTSHSKAWKVFIFEFLI